MAGTGNRVKQSLRDSLRQQQGVILEEFRKRTPGYGGVHQVHPPGQEHVHSGEYVYTGNLASRWQFVDGTGLRTVGAIVNDAPYASLVEYGYMDKAGNHVHAGGHRIIESTLRGSNVRRMYAEMAQKALIVSLATMEYGPAGKKVARAQVGPAAVGRKKDGVNVFFKQGKTFIRGRPGRGVSTASLKKAATKLGRALTDMMNAGVARGNSRRANILS